MHSWNGTCSYVGDLLYDMNFNFVKLKNFVQLNFVS